MKLLLLSTPADDSYVERFQRLPSLRGHKILRSVKTIDNVVALDRTCQANGIEGIFCTQADALARILEDTPDYIKPDNRKKITLDNYCGSVLKLRSGIEVVILNPLERLRTVAEEKFVVDRYLSKLTKRASWYQQTKFQWHEVTLDNRETALSEIASAYLCAIDIETPWPQDSLRTMRCVSYTTYDPKIHSTRSWVVPFDQTWHWNFIKQANASDSRKVFQNGLFDNSYFLRWGAPVKNYFYDTFHLFHSWLAELPKTLDFIASFAIRDIRYWKQDGKTGNLQDLYRYCALDGWATINCLLSILSECPDWAISNYTDHEFPLVFPCMNAAMEGLDMDVERFQQIAIKKEKQVEELLARIRYLVACPDYNPGSPKQNSNLFTLLGCGDLIKQDHLSDRENASRGTGKIPTQKAKARHPLNNFLLTQIEDYKKERKQWGTYFDESKLWFGRAYYSINPGKTDSGRANSEESAFDCGWQIQNVPRDDLSFKECVLAPPGWYIAEADKAQSEARCVGYLSGETKLIDLVESTHDYHSWNASAFFGVPYEKIFQEACEANGFKQKTLDKALRDLSKRTNHGANYNMGAAVMLDTMGPLKVAQAKVTLKLPSFMRLLDVTAHLLAQYDKTYPAVRGRWYAHIISTVERTGMLVSPFGWVRRIFGDPKNNKQDLNSIVAHGPQNLSVAVINREWYKIWRATVYGDLVGRVRIKAQIHDSLLFIYRALPDAQKVLAMMDTKVQVTGSDGVTRTMFIPSDLSTGEKPTRRWSELK